MKASVILSAFLLLVFASSAFAAPLAEDEGTITSNGDLQGDVGTEGNVTYANGVACSSNSDCNSGYCVDGYCCDSACSGACDACNLSGYLGTCTDSNSLCSGTSSSCYCSSGSCVSCSTGYTCSSYSCTATETGSSSSSGSGGGGGGAASPEASCEESWGCSDWTECSPSGTQTRICSDANACGTTESKPETSRSCTYVAPSAEECTERWKCSDWGECSGGTQTRVCVDLEGCGTYESKPEESRPCTEETVLEPSPIPLAVPIVVTASIIAVVIALIAAIKLGIFSRMVSSYDTRKGHGFWGSQKYSYRKKRRFRAF